MSIHNSSQKTNIHRTISFHIFTAEPPTTCEFWYLLQKGHLPSRVMRVLESFKLGLTTSFITHGFPRLWINKQTPHSYREFNPEELTKRLHRSSKRCPGWVLCPSKSSSVWSLVLYFHKSQSLSFPHLSTILNWGSGFVEGLKVVLCEIWTTWRGLAQTGTCAMKVHVAGACTTFPIMHFFTGGLPTVCPYIWLVSVEKGA